MCTVVYYVDSVSHDHWLRVQNNDLKQTRQGLLWLNTVGTIRQSRVLTYPISNSNTFNIWNRAVSAQICNKQTWKKWQISRNRFACSQGAQVECLCKKRYSLWNGRLQRTVPYRGVLLIRDCTVLGIFFPQNICPMLLVGINNASKVYLILGMCGAVSSLNLIGIFYQFIRIS